MPQTKLDSIRKAREKGIAVYLTAFFMMVMIPVVGLAIDGGYAFVIRTRLSAAADAAALAAGRGINLSGTVAQAQAQATTQATAFFNANFPSGYLNTNTLASTRVVTPTFTLQNDTNGKPNGVLSISVFAQVQAPTYFMRWLGINSLTINDNGTATRRNLVMEIVLDKSSSMGSRPNGSSGTIPMSLVSTDSSCTAMVYSTAQFIKYFSPYDTLGELSFSATIYDDNNASSDGSYNASTNYWQSGAAGMTNSISDIQCGSNTNTTAALYQAYQDIKTVNQKLAQNVIVLFTDGVPNAVNATFPVRTKVDSRMSPAQGGGSGCQDTGGTTLCTTGVANAVNCPGSTGCASSSPSWGMAVCTTTTGTIKGVIEQWASFSVNGGTLNGIDPIFSTDSNPSIPSGCSGGANVTQTIAYIPNTDYFSNSTINVTNSSASTVASPWFQWLYQVNQQCAPNGTQITSGNNACKNLGDSWTNYSTTGAGADNNTFQSGPYNGYMRPDLPNSIGSASMTSAANMAYTIRSDTTYNITIDTVYLQGNGSDPVDRSFLQIVSNQPTIQPILYQPTATAYTNPYYQSNQQQGIWAATASTLQLEAMFQEIASSLLRISQ